MRRPAVELYDCVATEVSHRPVTGAEELDGREAMHEETIWDSDPIIADAAETGQ